MKIHSYWLISVAIVFILQLIITGDLVDAIVLTIIGAISSAIVNVICKMYESRNVFRYIWR